MRKLSHPDHLQQWKTKILEDRPAYDKTIVVTAGTCGRAAGALALVDALKAEIASRGLSGRVGLEVTGCHGFCEMEPSLIILPKGLFYKKLEPKDVPAIIKETILKDRIISALAFEDPSMGHRVARRKEIPFYQKQMRLLTEANVHIDPLRIEDYVAQDGYQPLSRSLFEMTSEGVVAEIKASGLRGRGGAGFPTGLKWEFCREAPGHPKYIICNADEGDPGAYMDRSLLEGNPHSVIEGMIIGAYAIGASDGFIYVRGDNPLAVKHVTRALDQARKHGLLGENILGSEFHFGIQIVQGAGVYVCGEETSLMASIEGRKAYPRQRPPFPAQEGLWGKPTNINNVETWANVPLILNKSAAWYMGIGTAQSKGTKIFSLIGRIANTGLVEVPMGITLREIIYDIGGGIKDGKSLKAVQTGGPAGGCLPASLIDLPIDYDSLDQAGSMMGSGGMVVMDETTCMVDVARYFLEFLQDESCGKCVPCRVGTRRLKEILTRITRGRGEAGDFVHLQDLAATMKSASLCGLGQSAANPVISMLRYFRDEYDAHILEKKCSALVCAEIVSSPCQHVCPIGQEASAYIALAAQGRFREAAEIVLKDNPLSSACARVCHHPCETACKAGKAGPPISIRALKRFVMDHASQDGPASEANSPEPHRDRVKGRAFAAEVKGQASGSPLAHGLYPRASTAELTPGQDPGPPAAVAVIGSGPAGLTAAYDLSVRGFRPVIFEALPVAGGMLAAGIPEFKLPKTALAVDIARIRNAGVEIKTGIVLGKDVTLDGLFADGFKAVLLATGAWKSKTLGVAGEQTKGVIPALDFIKKTNLGEKIPVGKNIVVAGDGMSLIFAARLAVRGAGVEKVTVVVRGSKADLPGPSEEIEAAMAEGIEFKFHAAPVKVLAKAKKVAGLECLKMESAPNAAGGRRPDIPVKGSEFTIPTSTIILAAGERPEASFLRPKDAVETRDDGSIITGAKTFQTSRPGVFAAGDAVAGPSTVVQAMAAGRAAAGMIMKFLDGGPLEKTYQLTRPSIYVEPAAGPTPPVETPRPAMPHLGPKERRRNFREVELGLTEAQARAEARRCLRCELETEDGREALKRFASAAGNLGRAEEPGR